MIRHCVVVCVVFICAILDASYAAKPFKYRYDMNAIEYRPTSNQINPIIHSRRSRKRMSGAAVSERDLLSVLEAARWAPSAFNIQPWRFVYIKRGTERFREVAEAQAIGNEWCREAGYLVVVLAKKNSLHDGKKKFNEWATFDVGGSVMAMLLEGAARGLALRPMGRFDLDRVLKAIGQPNMKEYDMPVIISVGHVRRSRQVSRPSQRYALKRFAMPNVFKERIENVR